MPSGPKEKTVTGKFEMNQEQQTIEFGSATGGARNDDPVTCLGITFENDEARRAYFTEELRQKLKDPEFRKIEGFPIGEDEDILNLSDPPYYTACPNPWIADFIKHYGKPYDPGCTLQPRTICFGCERGEERSDL